MIHNVLNFDGTGEAGISSKQATEIEIAAIVWPRITIVTPSFNQGKYIGETIRSVLSQNYPNLEYIIVDGGSTDDSVDVIRKHAQNLSWWISEKDNGQPHAINKGFARATGEIFGYLNSDDLLCPGALHAVARAYRSGARWIVGREMCFTDDGDEWEYEFLHSCSKVEWLTTQALPQPAVFWAASLHKQVGPFREHLHYTFDGEFWLRLRFHANVEPLVIDDVLARFRYHSVSKTVSHAARFEPEKRTVRAEYRRQLSPSEKLAAWLGEKRMNAIRDRSIALGHSAEGRGAEALLALLSSIATWPPMTLSRATAGAVRRALVASITGAKARPK